MCSSRPLASPSANLGLWCKCQTQAGVPGGMRRIPGLTHVHLHWGLCCYSPRHHLNSGMCGQ